MIKGSIKRQKPENKDKLPGYELYPASEDIYKKEKVEKNIDPADISERKNPSREIKLSGKDSWQEESGSDLDIPGSELDDEMENIGSEDEENNYYSLGDDYSEDNNDIHE